MNDPAVPQTIPLNHLDRMPWAWTSAPCRALGHMFSVRTNDRALGDYLASVLGSLVAMVPPAHMYSLIDRGEQTTQRYALFGNEKRLVFSESGSRVLSTMLWYVNHRALEWSHDLLLFHAGVVESDGRALLFPAHMEAGKTTLVAGLVRAGLRYLSDELAAVDMDSLIVRPFPKALSIDVGSWRVLADLAPTVDPDVERRYLGSTWHVDPRRIRSHAVAPASMPAFVIAPMYRPERPSELVPMTRADAVMLLCQNSFNATVHGRSGIEACAALARRSRCYRLFVGDLDSACRLVLDLL